MFWAKITSFTEFVTTKKFFVFFNSFFGFFTDISNNLAERYDYILKLFIVCFLADVKQPLLHGQKHSCSISR